MSSHVFIPGGAGFVGSQLAKRFKADGWSVTVLDNLKRRGSELNLPELKALGITFVHGDVRNPSDFEAIDGADLLVDCSAEPSVHAGSQGSPDYVVHTNLMGTYHMLEWARKKQAAFILLSTSRVYPIEKLNALPFSETETRYAWSSNSGTDIAGYSPKGIQENFSLEGPRSLYGTSKLCSELLLQEYCHNYQLKGIVNRCGILAGSHQMGKVDQGVIALWVARHLFNGQLAYHGYEGSGKQVRDLLHCEDLYQLIKAECSTTETWNGDIYNAGGGLKHSVSLLELTELCREVTGREIAIGCKPETSPLDLRSYLTDSDKAKQCFSWTPSWSPKDIVQDIHDWLIASPDELKPLFL